MNLLLKPFQSDAVDRFLRRLREAASNARRGDLRAVSLVSPTGSGKTVIATAAIERLLQGDEHYAPDPKTTILWLSDQPELNEQTRRKMLESSTVLGSAQLVVVDATFDTDLFKPGVVYFLNTQKLGKEKQLITPGDSRSYTVWETISNTVRERPGSFYVFLDEAHRGMVESTKVRNEANSIVQKFIKGSPGEIPPIPMIVGISATPERFNRLVEGTDRAIGPTPVRADDVAASGLLKEKIVFFHPQDDQHTDITMLRAAARSWKKYCDQWEAYCVAQSEPIVRPIFTVQVQDGSGKQLSKTDLDEVIEVVSDEAGTLPERAVAHAFQEGSAIKLRGREVRYLAPSDINADPDVQVVLFKTSLNTGWDCPRAEVMMSFRSATDATLIAQLVGRMVRTPLARRVDANEHLNSVALYLPHYNAQELTKVIDRLTKPDHDIMPPVKAVKGEDEVALNRAPGSDAIFAALAQIPSYTIPRARQTSQIVRLMKLAGMLSKDALNDDAIQQATDILVGRLRSAYAEIKDTEGFKQVVEKRGKIRVRAVNWQLNSNMTSEDDEVLIDIASENLNDLFEQAGRKLGEGLHKAWWRMRDAEDPSAKKLAKLELIALTLAPNVVKRVEAEAQRTVQDWLETTHKITINVLPEPRQQEYREIQRLASDPQQTTIAYPIIIDGTRSDTTWDKHLYVDVDGKYPEKFKSSWETTLMQRELTRSDVVGWLRNPDRKPWSFTVPFWLTSECKPFYPDFLLVRLVDGQYVIDILDPHLPNQEDSVPKARGLAEYADKHWTKFGRIELIQVDDNGQIQRLDVCRSAIRAKVKQLETSAQLRALYEAENT